MNPDDFMQNLTNGENYEITIHEWSLNLFNEEKSIDETVRTIRARINKVSGFSIQNIEPPKKYFMLSKNYNKIMAELKLRSIYDHLSNPDKEIVKERVSALIETRLFSPKELIEYGMKIVKSIFYNKPENLKRNPKNNDSGIVSGLKNYVPSRNTMIETSSHS